jgi:hypothetical protein
MMVEEPNLVVPRLHPLLNGGILSLHSKIHEITSTEDGICPFTSIYVSIGSKMNERTVQFPAHTTKTSPVKYKTNCLNQMVPAFLQTQPLSERPLCIIIDQFTNKTNIEENIRMLQAIPDVNMDICLLNAYCGKSFLRDLVNYIVELAREHAIPQEKVMICNFVKFMGSPNAQELACEDMIPEVIQNTLNNTVYSNCLYEWFGYRFHLYNFIYNYKNYGQHSFMYRDTIRSLEASIKKRMSDPFMVSVIQDSATNTLWDNVFDLTTPVSVLRNGLDSRLAISLKEYLVENGQLQIIRSVSIE